ncbi:MAG: signal peptidase I [Nanoarchaeota archaeon]|nr:signal peptidase I [Nanoarchaeota archaeon]MBU4284265.1 signal peptidase I [Nanoarchaeota archaeon]MBU4492775.1 signal peptidase I [Nanoarchaeota archaeon]
MKKKTLKKTWKKVWNFIWEDNSIWSWIVNIILAFILIKFIVYPGLGLALGTSYPIVAVVSNSMEHNNLNFDDWWQNSEEYYSGIGIVKSSFEKFPLKNGFNKGDIMILWRANPNNIKIGDVIVFISARTNPKPDPIIHRVIIIEEKDDNIIYQTKGDNYVTNRRQINGCFYDGCIYESDIWQNQILGKALFKVPYLGYIKIWFVDLLNLLIK